MILKLLINKAGGFWRIREKCMQSKIPFIRLFYKILYMFYVESYNSYIPLRVKFLSRPSFPHGIAGIFVSSDSVIGKNCVIFHQVTIGSNRLPDSKGTGSPNIGDNCYIGAGAKIIGNVKIGDNVRIGANCMVFKDIPSNSVVVSQPPRIIEKESLNNRFYMKRSGSWEYFEDNKWVVEQDKEIIESLEK
ncbi:serine acetyltransferase [Mesobacillus sp. S13]|uniref:serine acetyltransferase n=1 Tax=Mesobacillus sp. S13 TaxID=2880221 RepID=UPI001CF41FAF|nr:serine acetyltransferase [Mesobacillus sp. S13]